jgi:hypothetical protein
MRLARSGLTTTRPRHHEVFGTGGHWIAELVGFNGKIASLALLSARARHRGRRISRLEFVLARRRDLVILAIPSVCRLNDMDARRPVFQQFQRNPEACAYNGNASDAGEKPGTDFSSHNERLRWLSALRCLNFSSEAEFSQPILYLRRAHARECTPVAGQIGNPIDFPSSSL